MSEDTRKEIELAKFHQKIVDDLSFLKKKSTGIERQTKETNGRVTKNEENIAKALTIISGHSTIISHYKKEKDKAQEELISSQRDKIDDLEDERKSFYKKVILGIIGIILFILAFTGIINADLLKALI